MNTPSPRPPVPAAPAPAVSAVPGRGTGLNPPNRFEALRVEPDPDADPAERTLPRTQFFHDTTTTLLSRHESPDLPFRYGINPYRGCEHGCAYCFARPYHEYLGWSSGLDFESRILVKLRAPELLRHELSDPRWQPEPLALSGATDCYQPAERHFRLTRGLLAVCAELRHPVSLITKNALVGRDLDLLAELARHRCVSVHVSIVTLDRDLAGRLEPRASRPEARLEILRRLSAAGIPTGVMVAPVIPGLTDHELPAILAAAAAAGARRAGYILLRLPHAVKEIFAAWLDTHEPGKKARILDRLRSLRGGRLYDSSWNSRLRGEGIFADQLKSMFDVAARRAGLNREPVVLATGHFRRPGAQLSLF